jgi:protein SCO1/2
MSQPNRIKKVFVLLAILIVPSVFYLIVSSGKNNYEHLPILGPREPDPSGKTDTLYHSVPEFELTNQDGATYQSKTSEGQIVVAEFFFATCQTICPKMTMQMKRVQEKFKADPDIALWSFTVDPQKDTVEAMKAYAQKHEAITGKWQFLTGDKKVIYDLARYGFFLTALEGDGGPDDFIHSEKLVLLDKDRRIRGYYDGTDYEDINKLMDEILVLKWEYKNK